MKKIDTRIRSFVLRQGKMTDSQKRDHSELLPKFGLELPEQPYDFASIFKESGPLVLEIGFGMGHAFIDMVARYPDHRFLGVEVHTPGVATALRAIEQQCLTNVRIFHDDAYLVLQQAISNAALDRVNIYFPDPWHKKRHHKRRLVQAPFLQMLAQKMRSGALLHLATDWAEYAEWMQEECAESGCFDLVQDESIIKQECQMRGSTKFERRGEGLGHTITDLLYLKD